MIRANGLLFSLLFLHATVGFAPICVAADPLNPFETADRTRNAFGNAIGNLTNLEKREFSVGNMFFRQSWVQTGATTDGRDGLGPTYNAVSCGNCHIFDGRGIGVGAGEGATNVSLLFRLDGSEEQYGGQLNPLGLIMLSPNEDIPGEGRSFVRFLATKYKFPDGEEYELLTPVYNLTDWVFGEPTPSTRISPRVAPQTIGLGLLEKIPAAEIEAKADPLDLNNDGITGRALYVFNLRTLQFELGRFGWKSEQPTVEQQSAAAFHGDMGLTSALFPNENCPAPQIACQNAPPSKEIEVSDRTLARVTLYMKSIAVPRRRALPDDRGEQLFNAIGCANCHHPAYTVDGFKIQPFTDLLLHDMGPELADRDYGGQVLPTEWRTPPLWGTGLIHTVNGHQNLMHDGRARGVQEAILWHAGEARAAREAFKNLKKPERQALIDFVNSL